MILSSSSRVKRIALPRPVIDESRLPWYAQPVSWRPEGVPDPALLTLQEFIKIAGDRGTRLWTTTTKGGNLVVTDGRRRFALPRLHNGELPSALVEALVEKFGLEKFRTDFALDASPDDD